MRTDRQNTGKRGEDEACRYLEGLGHFIVERGYRHSHQEIDIISTDARGLHFVEVKTRTAPTTADPEVNVNEAKRRNMVKGAQSYLRTAPKCVTRDQEIFFDVVTVVLDGENATIEYYPQAFIPFYV